MGQANGKTGAVEGKRSQKDESPALLTVDKLAKLLDCSTRHIYRLETSDRMPKAIRLGSVVRWSRAVIDKWIEDGCPQALAV